MNVVPRPDSESCIKAMSIFVGSMSAQTLAGWLQTGDSREKAGSIPDSGSLNDEEG